MARYENEFNGIPARFSEPHGADPNYTGGYGGMRMRGWGGRAPYGEHRAHHLDDLGGSGGFGGIHRGVQPVPARGYDREWQEETDQRPFRNQRMMREFNSNSPALRRGYGREMEGPRERAPQRDWAIQRGYRQGYSNRGMSDAGFSENWARFPMRGGR